MNVKTVLLWILRLIASYILLQTLRFKFLGLPESVYIFTKVGMEPWGRIGSGIVELIAAVLLLIPRTTSFGALLAIGTMSGAIFFHLTKLGIEVMGDHGQLFYMAIVVWVSSAILLFVYREQLLSLLRNLSKQNS
jgi:uncharacterized membrane protein YphA (DoxX/SURF4 family)